ncbi:M1 family metallopeptidase [Empedobacter falsenii]|uniref:M1 family metallopeptidase n=1 Tax=Empedobacter falsenii TaxID=343874 RepID=UPI002575C8FC|nr:M1 family metallopeptidase [Empedobacter falsenii]MDM1299668.1 M1 family metallopeptidase [Empedobacter falsenii]MDM1319461.1 M1 family metallopeptidase [Empedobacter falsenii]
MKKLVLLLGLISITTNAQVLNNKQEFTQQDSLRGTNNEFRNWWDVKHYKISVEPDYQSKSIKGKSTITFDKTAPQQSDLLQIDLQDPMMVSAVKLNGKKISDFKRDGNVYFINVGKNIKNTSNQLELEYNGNPRVAVRAPWDGGWIFAKDEKGRNWMSVAVQGLGASAWFPNKDYLGDEPDNGMELEIIIPSYMDDKSGKGTEFKVQKSMIGVGNGRLVSTKSLKDKTTYTWKVVNPINNYNIIPYIGHYVNFKDTFEGEKGKLDLDYYVLDYNIDKAKSQFEQAKLMLKSFEHWFGPYPFYEDSFKIVEAPHLGMEHQSGIAYGNKFENGYLGRDLSGSGWGLKWDFIIVHEAGHEWFGNNITEKDVADMWIHEAFTAYSETLFTETYHGKDAASEYVRGTRKAIQNDIPIIGVYGVNQEGSGDMYYKGANMIHTLRTWMNNDEKFRQMLRGLNKEFYHQTVTTEQIENYIAKFSDLNLNAFFNQYLRTIKVPILELKQSGNKVEYRYTNVVDGFAMPLRLKDSEVTINPTTNWQTINNSTITRAIDVTINPNYYIDTHIIY